jgi:hypothetical protein
VVEVADAQPTCQGEIRELSEFVAVPPVALPENDGQETVNCDESIAADKYSSNESRDSFNSPNSTSSVLEANPWHCPDQMPVTI